jgi:UDP-N-acetylmuramate--alanine ligase
MNPRAIHLVGIGGAGMSGLARLAVQSGYRVSGTDRADSAVLADLRALGVDARAGHDGGAVPLDAQALVVSTAIAMCVPPPSAGCRFCIAQTFLPS